MSCPPYNVASRFDLRRQGLCFVCVPLVDMLTLQGCNRRGRCPYRVPTALTFPVQMVDQHSTALTDDSLLNAFLAQARGREAPGS